MKTPIVAATVLALATVSFETSASAQPIRFDQSLRTTTTSPLLTDVQFRGGGRGGFRRHLGGGPRFGGGHRYGGYRGGRGIGIGAGVAGLAAGALIGGAIASQAAPAYGYGYNGYGNGGYDYGYAPPPPPPATVYADGGVTGDNDAYCSQRFKSYDPGSGTYLGYDGLRHPCP